MLPLKPRQVSYVFMAETTTCKLRSRRHRRGLVLAISCDSMTGHLNLDSMICSIRLNSLPYYIRLDSLPCYIRLNSMTCWIGPW